jgi:hypothetical protein
MSLFEEWSPVTRDLGLIDAPIDRVVEEYLGWQQGLQLVHERVDVTSSLEAAFKILPPLSAEKRRKLFVGTSTNWTAFFQSGIQGSDPCPVMSVLSEKLECTAMRICTSFQGDLYRGTIWEVYAPIVLGGDAISGVRRTLYSANDGGSWVFGQSGEPFDFEERGLYDHSRKSERFNREIFTRYLGALGLEPFSDSFYKVSVESPATVLGTRSSWKNRPPEFSLAEVRSGKPWTK